MQDTGSSSGTWLNEKQLIVLDKSPASRPRVVKSGDFLKIGADFDEEEGVCLWPCICSS